MRENPIFKIGARAALVIGLLGGVTVIGEGVASALTPPSITTGAVTSVKPTSAVVSGTVVPHGHTTTWYFEYGTTTSYGGTTPSNTTGSTATVSATIAGLAPATSYHYRLVGTSAAGTTPGADGI